MKHIYAFLLLFSLFVCVAPAKSLPPVKAPFLKYAPLDSIVYMSNGINDFPLMALNIDGNLTPCHYAQVSKSQLEKLQQDFSLRNINPLGSSGALKKNPIYSATNNLNDAARLLLSTGNAKYAKIIRSILYNTLPPILKEQNMNRHIAAQSLINGAQCIYMTDTAGIYVNFFINSYVASSVQEKRFTLDVMTSLPFRPRVKIRIGKIPGQTLLSIRLIAPDSGERIPVYVNGRSFDYEMKQGYIIIHRKWNAGDEIYFDEPYTPFILPPFPGAPYGLVSLASLLYMPSALPSLPIEMSEQTDAAGFNLLEGKGFKATLYRDL